MTHDCPPHQVLILEEKAAREAEEASAAVAKLSAAETEAAKRLSLAADPTELLPSDLDHWRKFAPSPPPPPPPPKEGTEPTSDGLKDAKRGGEPALKELLLLSAECFEVAASYAARKLSRRVGATQYEDAETPDPSFCGATSRRPSPDSSRRSAHARHCGRC